MPAQAAPLLAQHGVERVLVYMGVLLVGAKEAGSIPDSGIELALA